MIKKSINIVVVLIVIISCKSFHSGENHISTINENKESGIQVTYGVAQGKGNDIKRAEFSKDVEEMAKNINAEMPNLEFNLLCTKNKSVFKLVDKLEKDDSFNYKMATLFFGDNNKTYFINRAEKEYFYKTEFDGQTYYIDISDTGNLWQLTNEKKIIDNYTCYLAHFKKKIISARTGKEEEQSFSAWYAPEIPYSFGPFQLFGLPGLIMEGHIGRKMYFVKKITFLENVKINSQKDIQKTPLDVLEKKAKSNAMSKTFNQ